MLNTGPAKILVKELMYKVIAATVFLVTYTNKRITCKVCLGSNRYIKNRKQSYERRKMNKKLIIGGQSFKSVENELIMSKREG